MAKRAISRVWVGSNWMEVSLTHIDLHIGSLVINSDWLIW